MKTYPLTSKRVIFQLRHRGLVKSWTTLDHDVELKVEIVQTRDKIRMVFQKVLSCKFRKNPGKIAPGGDLSLESAIHNSLTLIVLLLFVVFFLSGFSSTRHSEFIGQQGKGEASCNSSLQFPPASWASRHSPSEYWRNFIPSHRYGRNRTGNLWFPNTIC